MHLVITSKTRVLVYLLGLAVGASKGGAGFLAVWQKDVLGFFLVLFCFPLSQQRRFLAPAPLLDPGSIRVAFVQESLSGHAGFDFFPIFEVEYQKVLTSD